MTTPTLDLDQLITRLARNGTGVVRCEPGDTLVILMTDKPEQDLDEALNALLPDHPVIVLWGSPGALVVPPARPPVMLGIPGVGAPECVGCSASLWAGTEPQEISHDDDCVARPVTGAPYAADAFNPDDPQPELDTGPVPLTIDQIDKTLVTTLAEAGRMWGPAGVAHAAVLLATAQA